MRRVWVSFWVGLTLFGLNLECALYNAMTHHRWLALFNFVSAMVCAWGLKSVVETAHLDGQIVAYKETNRMIRKANDDMRDQLEAHRVDANRTLLH